MQMNESTIWIISVDSEAWKPRVSFTMLQGFKLATKPVKVYMATLMAAQENRDELLIKHSLQYKPGSQCK